MDKDNKLCNKCGLLPQDGTKPIPPCTCKKKKRCKKDCCDDGFAFRKVVIPAALGDDKTGKDKPANGAYTNSYVVYEANGAEYMYDSYGVYTPMESGGGSGGVSDFNELDNRPKYAGETMTGDTDIPDVSSDITNLQTQINSKQDALSAAQLSAVNSGIDSTKVGQIATNTSEITTIEQKIPSQASSSNQLADKNFVNSSIATNTAYYISDNGAPFASLADLEAYTGTVSNNDYAFVVGTDASGNTTYTRYKYNADSSEWAEEYVLNNSSFTAEQWATINSGITSGDVSKLTGLANIKSIGTNLSLDSNGELSATDTTYSDFTGTDGTSAGTAGLVPAPATIDADKFLKSDGTWDTAGGGGIPTDATFWGQTYDATSNSVTGNIYFPMNTNATHSIIKTYSGRQNRIDFNTAGQIIMSPAGTSVLTFGLQSNTEMGITLNKSIAANGHGFYGMNGVTLGSGVYPNGDTLRLRANNAIYVARASGTGNDPQIKGVADPTDNRDVANKRYVDSIYPVGAVFTSTSATAPTIAGGTWTEIGTQTIGSSTVHYYERTA